jgi:hypothetical protein
MKKVLFGFVALGLLLVASCGKEDCSTQTQNGQYVNNSSNQNCNIQQPYNNQYCTQCYQGQQGCTYNQQTGQYCQYQNGGQYQCNACQPGTQGCYYNQQTGQYCR